MFWDNTNNWQGYPWSGNIWSNTGDKTYSIPEYISGSARQLPLSYNLAVLGVDYTTIQSWADMVGAKALNTLMKGEVLLLPAGMEHEETASSTSGITVRALNDSADYFPAIISESMTNRPQITIINNETPASGLIIGLTFYSYAKAFDLQIGISTTAIIDAQKLVVCCEFTNSSQGVGCLSGDITATNAVADAGAVGFLAHSSLPMIECAIDKLKTWSVGPAYKFGFYSFNYDSILYNCAAIELDIGFIVYNHVMTRTNCLSQGHTIADTYDASAGGGSFVNTTCADSVPLSIAADGYTLLVADNKGTNLSGTFTDDINGTTWTIWDRSVNDI